MNKNEVISWLGILFGSILVAAGFVYFINPYNIVPGGVYGASIVLHNIFPSIKVGTFGYMFDIPLLIISAWCLGAKLGAKTLVASMITPLIMNTMTLYSYPTPEAVESLAPELLLGGIIDLRQNLILAVIIGSAVIGAGSGLVVRSGATTGGTDIIGMLMQKYLHIRFSRSIMIADSVVVIFGLVSFLTIGNNGESPVYLSLYSLVSIYIIAQTISRVLNGSKDDKLLFIISDHNLTTLHQFILKDLDRTATFIKSSGLYTHADKEMLFLVVSYKEIISVKKKIKEADPRAFVVVTDAYDTYGEGWKPLPNEDDVQPE